MKIIILIGILLIGFFIYSLVIASNDKVYKGDK